MRFGNVMKGTAACAALVWTLAAPVAIAGDLPSGQDVLDKAIEATGGKDAIMKVKSRVIKGTFSMPSQGIEATIELYQLAPDSMYSKVVIPGMTTEEQGTNGKVYWALSTMSGPRILDDKEKQVLVRQADIYSDLHPEKYYESIECVAVEDVEGQACNKLVLTPKGGEDPETRYYSVDSGLLVKLEQIQPSQMGDLSVTSMMTDYREVDGLKIPFKTTMSMNSMQQIMAFESVETNVDVDKSMFELPEELADEADDEG